MPSLTNYDLAYFLNTDDVFGKTYRLEISKKRGVDPIPTPTSIIAKKNFVNIKWGGNSSANVPTEGRIIGSRMTVELLGIDGVGGGQYEDLFASDERQHLVELYRRTTDGGNLLIWKGFLVPDAYIQEIKDINSSITFYAADGLSLLNSEYLSEDFEMIDGIKLIDIFLEYINRLGLEFDLREIMGYKKRSSLSYIEPILSQLGVHLNAFFKDTQNIAQSFSYTEAIEFILRSFNARMVQGGDGKLWISALGSESAAVGVDGGTYSLHEKEFGSVGWSAPVGINKSDYNYSIKNDFRTSDRSLIKTMEPIAKEVYLRYDARPINAIYNGQIIVANEFSSPSTVKGWDLNDTKAIASSDFSASRGRYSIKLFNFANRVSDSDFRNIPRANLVSGVNNLIQGYTSPSVARWKINNIGNQYVALFKMKCLIEATTGIPDGAGVGIRYSLEHIQDGTGTSSFYDFGSRAWTRQTGSDPNYQYDNNGAHLNFRFKLFGFNQRAEWFQEEETILLPADYGQINFRVHNPNFAVNGAMDIYFDDIQLFIYPTSGNFNNYNPNVISKVYASTNDAPSSESVDDVIHVGSTEYSDELTGKVSGQYWDYTEDDFIQGVSWRHIDLGGTTGQALERYVQTSYLSLYSSNVVRYEGTLIRNTSSNLVADSKTFSPIDSLTVDYDGHSENGKLLVTNLEFDVKNSQYNFRGVLMPVNEAV